jgi:RNA recognition motif-containing protein
MLFAAFKDRYKTALYAKVFKEEVKYKIRCYGFVYFSDGSEITKAIAEMHETTIMGRQIKTGPGLKQPSRNIEKPNLNATRPVTRFDMATLEEFAHQSLAHLHGIDSGLKQVKTTTYAIEDDRQSHNDRKTLQVLTLPQSSQTAIQQLAKKIDVISNPVKNDPKIMHGQNNQQRNLLEVISSAFGSRQECHRS